jgi:hypothetical protein
MQVAGEGLQHPAQRPVVDPALEAPMAGLIRRIPGRHILPGRARAEHPEDAVEYVAGIAPRAATAIASHTGLRQEGFENGPLLVGQIHTLRYDVPPGFVHRPALGFMR